jgi:diguanylate cyclase (GGDEF)-like protein
MAAAMADTRILVVEDDADLRHQLRGLFEDEGLSVSEAADGLAALDAARRDHPDIVLLDLALPMLSGDAVHERLRAHYRTRNIPILILSTTSDVDRKVERLAAGADDYITKPFEIAELVGRVRAALMRTQSLRDLSPLTGLPGNAALTNEMNDRIAAKRAFSLLHVDLDDFKSFNDRYGYATGDRAIISLADVIEHTIDLGGDADFVGHIGGDDFMVLSEAPDPELLAQEIAERFELVAAALHEPEDRERGWFVATDRVGTVRQVPLASISIGITRCLGEGDENAAHLAHLASEMKEVAKRTVGSSWSMDRRER